MPARDLLKLERALTADICNPDPAVLERVNDLIQEHLLWVVGELAQQRVRDVDAVNRLLHLYARTNLLKAMIREPEKFNLKETKDLFKSTRVEEEQDAGPKGDIVKAIQDLDIPDAAKQKLLAKAIDTVGAQARAALGR